MFNRTPSLHICLFGDRALIHGPACRIHRIRILALAAVFVCGRMDTCGSYGKIQVGTPGRAAGRILCPCTLPYILFTVSLSTPDTFIFSHAAKNSLFSMVPLWSASICSKITRISSKALRICWVAHVEVVPKLSVERR